MYIDMSDTHFNGDSDLDAGGLDRVFAHEFTHVAQNSKFAELPLGYLTEGLAELTHGIDDWRTYDIKRFAGDADLLEQHMIGQQSSYQYSADYMLWRYLAKQVSDIDAPAFGNITAKVKLDKNTDSYYISDENKAETASSSGKFKVSSLADKNYVAENFVAQSIVGGNDSINTRSGSDTVNSGAGDDVIDYFTGKYMSTAGGDGNDSIYSENRISYGSRTYAYNTLDGGAGNDFLAGNAGNDTLKGDAGRDTIFGFDRSSRNRC